MSGREDQLKSQLRTAQQKLRELESDHKKELLEKSRIINELSVERSRLPPSKSRVVQMYATVLSRN